MRDETGSLAESTPAAPDVAPDDAAPVVADDSTSPEADHLAPLTHIDPLDRYRNYARVGGVVDRTKPPKDRRVDWAAEQRPLICDHEMTRGEIKARRRYWRRLSDRRYAANKPAAIAYALGLYHGPIPELQTRAQFERYWTLARLQRIADRWDLEPVGPDYASARMRATREHYLAEAPLIAQELVAAGRNPKVPWTARINAMLGAARMASEACPTTVEDLGLPPLIPENWDLIFSLLPQLAARIPGEKRSEMIVGAIREWLAVTKPVEKPSTTPRRVEFVHDAPGTAPALEDDGADDIPPPPPPPSAVGLVEDPTLPSVIDPSDADDIDSMIGEIVAPPAKVVS